MIQHVQIVHLSEARSIDQVVDQRPQPNEEQKAPEVPEFGVV